MAEHKKPLTKCAKEFVKAGVAVRLAIRLQRTGALGEWSNNVVDEALKAEERAAHNFAVEQGFDDAELSATFSTASGPGGGKPPTGG